MGSVIEKLVFALMVPVMLSNTSTNQLLHSPATYGTQGDVIGIQMPAYSYIEFPEPYSPIVVPAPKNPTAATHSQTPVRQTQTRQTTTTQTTTPAQKCGNHWGSIRLDNRAALNVYTSTTTECTPDQDVAIYQSSATPTLNNRSLYLYAHNYANLFDPIKSTNTVTITQNGVTKTFRIVHTQIYDYRTQMQPMMNDALNARRVVNTINPSIDPTNTKTFIALMTCYGAPAANIGATQRFIAFGVEI